MPSTIPFGICARSCSGRTAGGGSCRMVAAPLAIRLEFVAAWISPSGSMPAQLGGGSHPPTAPVSPSSFDPTRPRPGSGRRRPRRPRWRSYPNCRRQQPRPRTLVARDFRQPAHGVPAPSSPSSLRPVAGHHADLQPQLVAEHTSSARRRRSSAPNSPAGRMRRTDPVRIKN
jgi:hypothetical protein